MALGCVGLGLHLSCAWVARTREGEQFVFSSSEYIFNIL